MSATSPPSGRTTVRRGSNRADYDPATVRSILASGVVAHVGVTSDSGPIVIPMAYGITDDSLLLHGSVANAMMRAGTSVDICATITIVDGLVVARTPFHNSMNYRSVVVRGMATKVTEPEAKLAALKIINDHIAPLWDNARPPNEQELKKTLVLSVPLVEASAKIRDGDPIDDEEDLGGPHWSGVVPMTTSWGQPYSAADLTPGIGTPDPISALADTDAHL